MTTPVLQESTDEGIAQQVQSGDTEAFGVLVERYEAKMLRYGRKFLFNYDDVEDAVQTVFIKAYSNIQSFNIARKFSSWLYRIAHNTFINMIKKKGREPLLFFDPDVILFHSVPDDRADKEVELRGMREVLDQGLDKLDSKYREVLVLYYFEEKDYREIAEILHVPVATVGVRLKRARERLKNFIKEEKI